MKAVNEHTPRILTSKAIIRFQDCDPYAHLNNGRYLDYFMNGREDQVRAAYDFDIYGYSRETGLGWVVTQNQIAYLLPALLMEEVTLESQLIEARPKSLKIEMRMLDAGQALKSLLWVDLVHVDIKKGRSTEHPAELQQLFEHVLSPVEEKDFNLRLKKLNTR